MRFSIRGFQGPLARATRDQLLQRGHQLAESGTDCLIYFPGETAELAALVAEGGFRRIVLRSHAYAYGSSAKNPGMITEERVSLLPAGAPSQHWLRAEELAARHPNWAAVRLATVLAADEGDPLVRCLDRNRFLEQPREGEIPIRLGPSGFEAVRAARRASLDVEDLGGFDDRVFLREAFRAQALVRRPVGPALDAEHLPAFRTARLYLRDGWPPRLGDTQAEGHK